MKTVCDTVFMLLLCVSMGLCEPTCVDERLEMSLFAEAPNIVQPVSAVVDPLGRLLVIENHTHFRPEDYVGPSTDRILIVSDGDQDGKAESFDVFFEGEKDSMDLAVAPDGAIYLATRRKILRFETKDDGSVESAKTIIELETEGNYPHNGLSGLVFDLDGMLQFGFGENLGKSYKLLGSDGTELSGGAEGGSTYRCTPDGKGLERIATGFWNPFGQCMDAFGNIFAVDNDPDATPPCRLVHVTEGANFGYQFRYGRPGTHPLQTWTGELPGTIGMVAGTGEAPCEVIYCLPNENGGLPEDYVGDLLVASWGDHRIERYRLKTKGASFEATRSVIVQGDTNFWPVGIAVANDGSLFVTDWGSRSYPLHGEGKIWRLSAREIEKPKKGKRQRRRPIIKQIGVADRMLAPDISKNELVQIANSAETIHLRAMAVRLLGKRGYDTLAFADNRSLPIRREAIRYLEKKHNWRDVASMLKSKDPTLHSLAVRSLAENEALLLTHWCTPEYLRSPPKGEERLAVGVALACESTNNEVLHPLIPAMLKSTSGEIRLVAARWIADRKLEAYLPDVQREIAKFKGSFRLLLAFVGAEQHLNGGKLNAESLKEALSRILTDETSLANTKASALQAASPNSLDLELIQDSLKSNEKSVQREAIYLLLDDRREEALPLLDAIIHDDSIAADLRADALVVMDHARHDVERLVSLASHDSDELRVTAVRLLTGEKLEKEQRARLPDPMRDLLDARMARPQRSADQVLQSISSSKAKGDIDNGRRLFHNTRFLQCSKCHRVSNRGANIGPELTGIGMTQSADQLLRSIVHPSERVAPQYQSWTIIDQEGRSRTGYHFASKRLVETFVDASGAQFQIAQDEIEERIAGKQSIMPTGLIDHLTVQEVSDLLAYLSE